MLFAILATQVKRRAPNMRTFMELVRVRWGNAAHITFICFALTTNVIVSAMLILGGAATLNALTGMPTNAAAFIIPIVACLPYTLIGGLRATFLAHYFNTAFIFFALFVFMFVGYVGGGSDFYGSPSTVLESMDATSKYAVLTHVDWSPEEKSPETDPAQFGMQGFTAFIQNRGICYDTDGNSMEKTCAYTARGLDDYCHKACKENSLDVQACGDLASGCITTSKIDHWEQSGCDNAAGEKCAPSLATMTSPSGFIFGIVNIVGNFGTVFVDQSYWQSAIAVKPEMAASGYILGGVVWFAVPMMMGSTHGLLGRALAGDFSLVNGASHITEADSGSGLTPARVAVEILGVPGAWVLLIMLFMAIVSTGCAEIIAVATILTYDVYCEYLNPELKGDRMKCRQIFYASLCGKSTTYEGTDLVTFDELADKSKQTLPAHEVAATLKTLQDARILPEGRAFKMEECAAIESVLKPYVETDNKISYENLYFALQSQVLCKSNYEAAVMLRVMKFFCCCFAVFMGFLAVVLQQAGLGLGFVYMSMGIFVGPAVAPAAMAILMEKASAQACTFGAIAGLCGGLTTWFATAQYLYGEVSISTLGKDHPFLWSNVVSICFSGFVAIAGSLANPDTKFQWKYLGAQLPLVDDMPPTIDCGSAEELDKKLIKSYNNSVIWANFLFIFLCVLLPGVLHLGGFVFGTLGFTIWIAVFGMWCFVGGLSVIILPIYDFMNDVAAAKKSAEAMGEKKPAA
jgi:Na+/proline symporter